MKRKLFVLGYTGYYNLGDDLMIDIIYEKIIPRFETLVLSRRTYYKKRIKYINRYNLIKYFLSIKKGDILLNLGGIFQDKTGFLSFFYYFVMNLIFLSRKGQIIFLSTDFLDVRYNNRFVCFLLKFSQLTVLRSKTEYMYYCKRFKNVYYSPDMVFLCQFADEFEKKEPAPYVLVSLRENRKNAQFLKSLRHTGYTFKFLLMKNEEGLKRQVRRDFPENDIHSYNYINKNKILDLIYNAERIIAMRYHVGIMGLLFNKRVGIVDFSNKMKILNKDFGLFYTNGKKNIDKINRSGYINRREIKKSWKTLFQKIEQI